MQLGAVSGLNSGTRGVYYFDVFESRRESYIGLDPSAPLPPEPPEKTDDVFADGFESGDLSAWSSAATGGGDLSVTSEAAITGDYGMQALIDDNTALYVRDWSPFEETRYRARFSFDPNSITMAANNAHYLFYGLNREGTVVLRLELRFTGSDYELRAAAVNDGSGWSYTPWVALSDAAHRLDLAWQAASAPGANDGGLTFWLDEVEQAELTGIDNDTRRVDYVQLGATAGLDSGTRGVYFFDAFESRRDAYAGPQAAGPVHLHAAALEETVEYPELAASQAFLQTTTTLAPSAPASPASFADSSVQGTSGQGALAAPLALSENTENPSEVTTTTLTYTYDPANRLTGAAYSSGASFQYEYDAAGNRLSQVVDLGLGPVETAYQYDAANRLVQVDGAAYTWDDNGNLLSDGTRTYAYDHANRLKTVNNGQNAYSYGYNGLGERLQQSVDGVATHYTLDLARGLTQVLSDGERAFLYGHGRIGQQGAGGMDYFLTDALGSVRQLVGEAGEVSLSKAYRPYGEVLEGSGSGATSYGFTGEWTDSYINLIYLRSRYYSTEIGRFISRDTWRGDYYRPQSLNRWNYVEGNPISRLDPSGKWICTGIGLLYNKDCEDWVEDALNQLNISGPIGSSITNFFHSRDKMLKISVLGSCINPVFAGNIWGIKVTFMPVPGIAMAIPPDSIFINPIFHNGPRATGDGVATFAHEITHLEQGLFRAFSMQGEMLTAVFTYQLEDELGIAHYIEGVDIVNAGWNPWDIQDLESFKTHPRWVNGFSLYPLTPIIGSFSRDWLKKWGTDFPYFVPNPPLPQQHLSNPLPPGLPPSTPGTPTPPGYPPSTPTP